MRKMIATARYVAVFLSKARITRVTFAENISALAVSITNCLANTEPARREITQSSSAVTTLATKEITQSSSAVILLAMEEVTDNCLAVTLSARAEAIRSVDTAADTFAVDRTTT